MYNTLIAGGLLALRLAPQKFGAPWAPPFRAFVAAIAFYFACNVFLLVAPLLPPERGFRPYQSLPYWVCASPFPLSPLSPCSLSARCCFADADNGACQAHPVMGLSISLVGTAYWYGSFVWAPRRGGYALEKQLVVNEDGVPRNVFVKVAVDEL